MRKMSLWDWHFPHQTFLPHFTCLFCQYDRKKLVMVTVNFKKTELIPVWLDKMIPSMFLLLRPTLKCLRLLFFKAYFLFLFLNIWLEIRYLIFNFMSFLFRIRNKNICWGGIPTNMEVFHVTFMRLSHSLLLSTYPTTFSWYGISPRVSAVR